MITDDLQNLSNPKKAKQLSRYFKTGRGEYGEGDVFLGLQVPEIRKIAKNYTGLNFKDLEKLLANEIHEYRLAALLILVDRFKRADRKEQKEIYEFYLKNTDGIDNWDLVDLSAHEIVGKYLLDKKPDILYELAQSKNMWERRIAVVATYTFIRSNRFEENLKIAKMLLYDEEDLIHKAVGWMLREIGKRNQDTEERFLKRYYKKMPRTMLRYAIEKFDKTKRKYYMS
ncbi:DNA alkylation repair protein [Candidatus Micrarchaeota archaeon]|nr:DNA alkylation repair protein [Candidatus Micrarchaeota archaeon]MBU1681365.1 DNA alkylation repair protein [Candidatus Micrarchaeota archaeon]